MKGKGKLCVQLNEKRRHVEILISDTGSGIKKNFCQKFSSQDLQLKQEDGGLDCHLQKEL